MDWQLLRIQHIPLQQQFSFLEAYFLCLRGNFYSIFRFSEEDCSSCCSMCATRLSHTNIHTQENIIKQPSCYYNCFCSFFHSFLQSSLSINFIEIIPENIPRYLHRHVSPIAFSISLSENWSWLFPLFPIWFAIKYYSSENYEILLNAIEILQLINQNFR